MTNLPIFLIFLFLPSIFCFPSLPADSSSTGILSRFRRHYNCYSSCNSCFSSCNTCQQSYCYQDYYCSDCCRQKCVTPTPTTPTTAAPPVTTTGTSITPVTTTVRPTSPRSIPTSKPSVVNNTVNVNTSSKHTVTNVLNNSNSIHIPIHINNQNVVKISNRVTMNATKSTNGGPIISSTFRPTEGPPPTSPPASTSKPTDDSVTVIVITIPYHGYYVYPIDTLPCYSETYGCSIQRSSWSGNICQGWGSWGHSWGFTSGLDWGSFSGCQSVSQDCGYCGNNFYSGFSSSSWQYSSCYGCFI